MEVVLLPAVAVAAHGGVGPGELLAACLSLSLSLSFYLYIYINVYVIYIYIYIYIYIARVGGARAAVCHQSAPVHTSCQTVPAL